MGFKEILGNSEGVAFANVLLRLRNPMVLRFTYTNYRNEQSERKVVAEKVWFGSTEWHSEPCLLLTAYDIDKAAHRDFKVADIRPDTLTADRV